MEQETIVEAAFNYAAQRFPNGESKDCGIVAQEQYACRAGFMAGAEWQRNHVWHDATEKPDGKRRYLVETHLGKRTHHSVWTKAFTPEEKVEDDGFLVRWAYLEDILPLPCKERRKL